MKVKVSYTVDCDDVPNLVKDILDKCRATLVDASNINFDFAHLERAARDITKLQADLDMVSSQLEDCLNLSRGYLEVQYAKMTPEDTPVEAPAQTQGERGHDE